MKIQLLIITMWSAVALSQVDQATDLENRQQQTTDRIEQQLPPPPQSAVEKAVRQSNPKKLNNENLRKAETKIEEEIERSTGKDARNPAKDLPATPTPPALSEPVSKPLKPADR